MLLSIALIIIITLSLSKLFKLFNLPPILGMIISGILMGPYVFNLIDKSILAQSAELRQIALIVILFRAGLTLETKDLKTFGKRAMLLSFIPATLEIIAVGLLAPLLFEITYLESFMMGAVVAAVSPAIVVPRMIEFIKKSYGKEKKIPQLILASASIDDVFVIIIFMSLIEMHQGETLSVMTAFLIPLSLVLGSLLGIISGILHVKLFKIFHMRDTVKVLIIFASSFLMVVLESYLKSHLSISGLIAVMSFGITMHHGYPILAKRLHLKFEKIWMIAEIMLFVLVGAHVQIMMIPEIGLLAILLILSGLIFRMIGVLVSLLKSNFNCKERLFTMFSYLPKATVQAAIGAIPLALGVESGNLILSIAVLSILITAPLGAICIDKTYQKLLIHDVKL